MRFLCQIYTIFLIVLALTSCGSKANKNEDKIPTDSVKAFYDEVVAKKMLFSDIVQTDFAKKYIIEKYSKQYYDVVMKNLRTDFQPIEGSGFASYDYKVYSNKSDYERIALDLTFSLSKYPGYYSSMSLDIEKLDCRYKIDGTLNTGNWEFHYLENEFDEEMKEYPYISTKLRYNDDENLYVLLCRRGGGFEFRFMGDITEYGSRNSYRMLLKTRNYAQKEIQIDNYFSNVLAIYNDEGTHDLMEFFNDYDPEKKMVIIYDDKMTGIYKKAVVESSSAGQDIYAAMYTHVLQADINTIGD